MTILSELLGYADRSLNKTGIPSESKKEEMDPGWATLTQRVNYQPLGLQRNICYLNGPFDLVGVRHTKT